MPEFGAVAFDMKKRTYHPLVFRPNPPPPGVPGEFAALERRMAFTRRAATGALPEGMLEDDAPEEDPAAPAPVRYRVSFRHVSGFEKPEDAFARLEERLPKDSIIPTHVMVVKDAGNDYAMSFNVYTAWQGSEPISAADITGNGGNSMVMLNLDDIKDFEDSLVGPRRFAAVAYDKAAAQFVPVYFLMSEPAAPLFGKNTATFLWMTSVTGHHFQTLEQAVTYLREGHIKPHEMLTTDVLLVETFLELTNAAIEALPFGPSQPLSADHIKEIALPRARGARQFISARDIDAIRQSPPSPRTLGRE